MGNISSLAEPREVVRVIRQDGRVLEFYDDLPVEELMVVYPRFVVCQDQVQQNGQVKRKLLGAKDVLLKGQVYLLLVKSSPEAQAQVQKQKVTQTTSKGANRLSERPAKVKSLDMRTPGGTINSAHPAAVPAPTKAGLAPRQAFPKEQISKFLESGSVDIITKAGTARLSGPQLTRLLNEGKISTRMPSPKPSTLSPELESIPEVPHQLSAV